MKRIVVVGCFVTYLTLTTPFVRAVEPQQGEPPQMSAELKAQLTKSFESLGTSEPWQKKIFQEEALVEYLKFIKDYRMEGQQLKTEVDTASLKRYLALHFPSKAQVSVVIDVDSKCARCEGVVPSLQHLMKAKLERRELTPVFFESASELGAQSAIGSVRIRLVNQVDIEHPEEEHTAVKWVSELPIKPSGKSVKTSGEMELLKNDSLDSAINRLWIDAMNDVGSAILASNNSEDSGQGGQEILLSVRGFKDAGRLKQLKMIFKEVLKSRGGIQERKLQIGQITYAVRSQLTAAELAKVIGGISSESLKLTAKEGPAGSVEVQIE